MSDSEPEVPYRPSETLSENGEASTHAHQVRKVIRK